MKTPVTTRCQRGFSMIEAMVSVVILSFGLLAIAGFQVRVLASSAGANFGDQAARLAVDMAERIRANPYAAGRPGNSYYAEQSSWGAPGAKPLRDCNQASCTTWEIGLYDIWSWKTAVANALPEGDAIILEEKGQLRVVVTWKDNAQFVSPPGEASGCPASTTRSCHRIMVGIPNQ
jgi:type IV pilus assembly protein PilV